MTNPSKSCDIETSHKSFSLVNSGKRRHYFIVQFSQKLNIYVGDIHTLSVKCVWSSDVTSLQVLGTRYPPQWCTFYRFLPEPSQRAPALTVKQIFSVSLRSMKSVFRNRTAHKADVRYMHRRLRQFRRSKLLRLSLWASQVNSARVNSLYGLVTFRQSNASLRGDINRDIVLIATLCFIKKENNWTNFYHCLMLAYTLKLRIGSDSRIKIKVILRYLAP